MGSINPINRIFSNHESELQSIYKLHVENISQDKEPQMSLLKLLDVKDTTKEKIFQKLFNL